jgi:hypothetical protein
VIVRAAMTVRVATTVIAGPTLAPTHNADQMT